MREDQRDGVVIARIAVDSHAFHGPTVLGPIRTYPTEARHHNAGRVSVPLTDAQLQTFLANGFLTLKSTLTDSYHRLIFERFDDVATGIGHFGNNLLPPIPELVEFFDDAVVKGAFTSVLGRDYSVHPHRALHKNPL